MLDPQVIMNLELERSYIVDRMRTGNLRGHGSRSAQHDGFDNRFVEVVQIDMLNID